jgi:putative protease
MNRVELLAPAGNKDAFVGAINAGANAVYLAGKNFGARKYASNFTLEEIKDLISYAHKRYVQVFVTVNTLVYEEEIKDFLAYTDALVAYHVDALIVQDLGILEVLVKRYPDTEIHASTQTNVYSIEQLKYLKELGVKRVILARETSIEDMKKMKAQVDIDLEVFVHGALCMSYSGNCYFSMLSGGRSGNRGECAQPCRLPYQLYRNEDMRSETCYLLSTKDLMTLPKIKDIIESGVVSLKIEGRMRRSEYVVHAVQTYRQAIDAFYKKEEYDAKAAIDELSYMFNRQFTKGYILKEDAKNIAYNIRPNHQGLEVGQVITYAKGKAKIHLSGNLRVGDGYRILGKTDVGGKVDRIIYQGSKIEQATKGMDIVLDLLKPVEPGSKIHKTMDKNLDEQVIPYMDERFKLIGIELKMEAFVGHPLRVKARVKEKEWIELASDYIIEKAKKQGQSKEAIMDQFLRFGDTFYYVKDIDIKSDEQGFIPNKVIKDLRRTLTSYMDEMGSNRKKPRILSSPLRLSKKVLLGNSISVKVESFAQYETVKGKVDQIYYTKNVKKASSQKDVLFQSRYGIEQGKEDRVVVHDFRKHLEATYLVSSPYMNVTNSLSVLSLLNRGFDKVTLSFELSVDQMLDLVKSFKKTYGFIPNIEVLVYGKMDAMLTKFCPIQQVEGTMHGCNLCERYFYDLKNQFGQSFAIKRDEDCHVRILHHKPINLLKDLKTLRGAGIKHFACYFTDEEKDQVEEIIKVLNKNLKG